MRLNYDLDMILMALRAGGIICIKHDHSQVELSQQPRSSELLPAAMLTRYSWQLVQMFIRLLTQFINNNIRYIFLPSAAQTEIKFSIQFNTFTSL